jgi:nuclear pore complex protein Nup54
MSSFSWSKPSDQLGQSFAGVNPLSTSTMGFAQPSGQIMAPKQQLSNISPSVVDQLQKIKESWDPTSEKCAFQHYFYNNVPPDQALLYIKPPGQDQGIWDEAIKNRPDNSSVPVLAVGFTDLQKRVSLQQAQVNAYRVRMHEINNKLNELSTRHDLYTTVKIAEMKTRHAKIVQRTLSLAVKIQVLKSRGYVLRPDEEVLKQKLEQLNKEIDDPAVFGRINEVWARMRVLRERAQAFDKQIQEFNMSRTSSLDWERDEEQLDKLAKILKAQQVGIAYLAKILTTDSEQVDGQLKALEEKQIEKQTRR